MWVAWRGGVAEQPCACAGAPCICGCGVGGQDRWRWPAQVTGGAGGQGFWLRAWGPQSVLRTVARPGSGRGGARVDLVRWLLRVGVHRRPGRPPRGRAAGRRGRSRAVRRAVVAPAPGTTPASSPPPGRVLSGPTDRRLAVCHRSSRPGATDGTSRGTRKLASSLLVVRVCGRPADRGGARRPAAGPLLFPLASPTLRTVAARVGRRASAWAGSRVGVRRASGRGGVGCVVSTAVGGASEMRVGAAIGARLAGEISYRPPGGRGDCPRPGCLGAWLGRGVAAVAARTVSGGCHTAASSRP